MNRAEEFVADYCSRSFFSLWSYANPQRRNGRELCDFLVVCDPHVIIFSVKEVRVSDTGDVTVDWKRWQREAIQKSVKQIYGAQRELEQLNSVRTKQGRVGLRLPNVGKRCIHRVAVAIGSEGKVPYTFGDFGKGFVHVVDERSFQTIMQELDTITDFVEYLKAKEELSHRGVEVVIEGGGEEDLLAFYLEKGRTFPPSFDLILVGPDRWKTFSESHAFRARQQADEASRAWDSLIEVLCRDHLAGVLLGERSLGDVERIVRAMARENRFSRRILGKKFLDFLDCSRRGSVRSRMLTSLGGITYVFLACPLQTPRESRRQELVLRCFVARGTHQANDIVVGIATETPGTHTGFSLDVTYLQKPDWTQEDVRNMKGIQRDTGFFAAPVRRNAHEDEYPEPAG